MRRVLPFLLVVGGIGLLAFVAVLALSGGAASDPGDGLLPRELAGLPVTRRSLGASAIDEVNQMHGIRFDLVSGAVGEYGSGRATLWVSVSPDERSAGQMATDMEARIAEGRSPFTALGIKMLDGRQVYMLEGLGQLHFYFQSGRQVIWLAADAELAEAALQQALEYYTD